jgi:hypothetical protein
VVTPLKASILPIGQFHLAMFHILHPAALQPSEESGKGSAAIDTSIKTMSFSFCIADVKTQVHETDNKT